MDDLDKEQGRVATAPLPFTAWVMRLRQIEAPGAASVRGGVQNPRVRHDGEARHFDHRQSAAGHDPGRGGVRKPHHAEVGGRVEVPLTSSRTTAVIGKSGRL